MAEGAFNIAQLARRLGLKNIRELPLVRSIQPVILAGDASELVPSLIPPTAWVGAEILPVIGEHGAVQVQAVQRGGCWVTIQAGSDVSIQWNWRLAAGDILAADPLGFTGVGVFNVGPEPIVAVFRQGTTIVAPSSFSMVLFSEASQSVRVDEIFVPTGQTLTFSSDDINKLVGVTLRIRELAAGDLTPTG